jgi:hypothetical protein
MIDNFLSSAPLYGAVFFHSADPAEVLYSSGAGVGSFSSKFGVGVGNST